MHPILDSLDRTDHEWIKRLLFTFNEGSIGKFEALAPVFMHEVHLTTFHYVDFQPRVFLQSLLQESYPFLRQKICLMALIESVFKRSANDRIMSFQTIAEETRLPIDEVEHLVMKALRFVSIRLPSSYCIYFIISRILLWNSLKLIRGTLDQVDQKATITWVQPRVLSKDQIRMLAQRLDGWIAKLGEVEARIAPEVLGGA